MLLFLLIGQINMVRSRVQPRSEKSIDDYHTEYEYVQVRVLEYK